MNTLTMGSGVGDWSTRRIKVIYLVRLNKQPFFIANVGLFVKRFLYVWQWDALLGRGHSFAWDWQIYYN